MSRHPVRAGAEPFASDGGPIGVLVCHGFTGSPEAVRPWAGHLAAAGFTVGAPLLPGHGTQWRDLADHDSPAIFAGTVTFIKEHGCKD